MPDGANTPHESALEFNRDEQWALHSAVLDYVERALEDADAPAPVVELAVLEEIETGEFRFTPFEYDRIKAILEAYAASDDAPDVDREPARSVLARIDSQCPSSLQP
jgi:hypothetical protein